MVGVFVGLNQLVDVRHGANPVIAIYKGMEQIWPMSLEPFEGGDQSHGSILEFVRYIGAGGDIENVDPTAGGILTINGGSLGSYDYTIKVGNQTITSFSNTDWFTTTEDSRGAIVVVKGDLTVDAGQIVVPSNRKLFVTIYVTGNLVLNGGISMTARGANHSVATGSNISAAAIRIATGTFSTVENPQVPVIGGNGAAPIVVSQGVTLVDTPGDEGSMGIDGETGGGGSGGNRDNASATGTVTSGGGADGTSFSGGPGGGAASNGASAGSGSPTGEDGQPDGGKGGGAANTDGGASQGGAGNPTGAGTATQTSTDGTGGILFVVCEGEYSGSGEVTAAGSQGGAGTSGNRPGGGGSGGGSVTILYGSDDGPTPTALGGAGGPGTGTASDAPGGNGGDGTARKLALAA